MDATHSVVPIVVEAPGSALPVMITAAATLGAAFLAQVLVRSFYQQDLRRQKLEDIWHLLLNAHRDFASAERLFRQYLDDAHGDDRQCFEAGTRHYISGINAIRDAYIPLDLYFPEHMEDLSHVTYLVECAKESMDNTGLDDPNIMKVDVAEHRKNVAGQLSQEIEAASERLRHKHRRLLRFPLPRPIERILTRWRLLRMRCELKLAQLRRRSRSDS